MTHSERLRSLGEAATPGPYDYEPYPAPDNELAGTGMHSWKVTSPHGSAGVWIENEADLRWILACVNAMPLALDVIEQVRHFLEVHNGYPRMREAFAAWDNQTQEPQ